MPKTPRRKFYVVRVNRTTGEGCGHQHGDIDKAWGCAEGIQRKRKLTKPEIVRMTRIVGDDTVRERYIGQLDENGQRVFYNQQ
jgi:hypothetical protein